MAGTKHPAYKKMMKLAQQAMWDEKKYDEIMAESSRIVESILMEDDDTVIPAAHRFRKFSDPGQESRIEQLEKLRDSQLKRVRADIWSISSAMKLIRERRTGEAMIHLDDMLKLKRKELVALQPEDE